MAFETSSSKRISEERTVGRSENLWGWQLAIQDLLKENILLIFLPKSGEGEGKDYPLVPSVRTALDYRLEALLAFEWLPKL